MDFTDMRQKLQELYNHFAGMDVFIIAGGPSILDVNLSLLNGKRLICINNSYKLFDDPTVIYWGDSAWLNKVSDETGNLTHFDLLSKHPCKFKFHARHAADGYIQQDKFGSCGECILKRTGDFGLDINPDNVRGNNSGAQAINFAFNMGAKRIILLGYDGQVVKGKTHWHGGHDNLPRSRVYEELFIPSINSMAKFIKNMGIEVINTNLSSKITCFKKESIDSILGR